MTNANAIVLHRLEVAWNYGVELVAELALRALPFIGIALGLLLLAACWGRIRRAHA